MRGRDNVRKRYLAHLAALNLGLVMRTIYGWGTPRRAAAVLLEFLATILRVLTLAWHTANRSTGTAFPAQMAGDGAAVAGA